MHIRNHSRPLMVLLSLSLFLSTQVLAEEYAELSACRLHYQTVVQPGATDIPAMDNWCLQTAKMNPLDVCADQKLYPFMATNSINSDQKSRQREAYRQECYRQQNSQVAGSTQTLQNATSTTSSSAPAGAVIAATAGVTYATPAAAGAPAQPILNLQDCSASANSNACQAANQSAQASFARAQSTYNANLATYNTQQKNAANLTTAERQQVQQATSNAVLQAGMQAMGAFGGGSSQNGSGGVQIGGGNPTTSVAAVEPPAGTYNTAPPASIFGNAFSRSANNLTNTANANLANGANSAETPLAPGQGQALQQSLSQQCSPPPFDSELMGRDCGGLPNEGQAADSPPPATALSSTANASDTATDQAITTADAQTRTLSTGGNSMPFTTFMGLYTPLSTQHIKEEFKVQKAACVKKAELANKFCLEGSSPGAKFAKGLIDYSGPILAAVRSAHKACSSTAKITNIAQTAMTLAKGVCVAMKLSCDASCATTRAIVEGINAQLAALRAAGTTDFTNATTACGLLVPPANGTCIAEVNQKKAIAENIVTTLTARFKEESGIEPGKTGAMIASCHDKTKDILLMGTNILTLLAAKGSAEKCEKALSASGGASSGDISTAEYCSVAANSTTQFCVCQKNPKGEGCSGAVAGPLPEASSSNQTGANLKSGSGVSGFAGGTGGGGSGSGSDFGIGSENGAATGLAADLNGKSSFGAGLGGASGAGAGGGGAGGGAGGDPSAAAAGSKDEKKSALGTLAGLANSLGGMFGGGRGGAAAGNGALSSQQQAAIQRKLASDKVAGEVTSSSGLDNFSKIKKSYGQKAETFMTAP